MNLFEKIKNAHLKIEQHYNVNALSAYLMLEHPQHARKIFWGFFILNMSMVLAFVYVVLHFEGQYKQPLQDCYDMLAKAGGVNNLEFIPVK